MQGEMQEKCCFSSPSCFETRLKIKKLLRYSILTISVDQIIQVQLWKMKSLLQTRACSWMAFLKCEQSKLGLSAPAYTDRPEAELRNKTSLQESVFVQSSAWTVRGTGGRCVFTTCQDGCRQKLRLTKLWKAWGDSKTSIQVQPCQALCGHH